MRRSIGVVVALVALLMMAVPAVANKGATIWRGETDFSRFVPCANGGEGEEVGGTVEDMVVEHQFTNPNGNQQSHFQFTIRGKAVGETTGDVYSVFSSQHENYMTVGKNSERSIAVIPQNDHVIAHGPNGGNLLINYHLREVWIDGEPQVEVWVTDIRCVKRGK